MLNLFTLILMILMLTACVTNSPNAESPLNSNQCSATSSAKINNTLFKVNAPNPFDGLVNPGMNIYNETLNIGLITKEIGLLEFSDFSIKNLHTGTYAGDKFTLNLERQNKICKHNKNNSKFIIEQYDTTNGKLKGCFISKFNCNNELIEINTKISGIVY